MDEHENTGSGRRTMDVAVSAVMVLATCGDPVGLKDPPRPAQRQHSSNPAKRFPAAARPDASKPTPV